MIFYPIYTLLASLALSVVIVIPVYYAISSLRVVNAETRKSWKQAAGQCSFKGEDFVKRVQKVCLHRRYILLEISSEHAFIKENMSISSGGVFYYVELDADNPGLVKVSARGAIYKNRINPNCLKSMVNLFYS